MAITIESIPASYSSAHDALWFVVSSDNVGLTNFKYVFDIQINSATVAEITLQANLSMTDQDLSAMQTLSWLSITRSATGKSTME
jgi:hypothetical protein